MAIRDNPLAYSVLGAAMQVHTTLGRGFLEAVYGDALEVELTRRGIPFERERDIRIFYNGHPLKSFYRADFLCGDNLIVELKAIKTIGNVEFAQVFNYLKATGVQFGLLLNFATQSLQYNYLTSPFLEESPGKALAAQ